MWIKWGGCGLIAPTSLCQIKIWIIIQYIPRTHKMELKPITMRLKSQYCSTFHHWCNHTSGAYAASCGEGNICSLILQLHYSCTGTGKLDRNGPLVDFDSMLDCLLRRHRIPKAAGHGTIATNGVSPLYQSVPSVCLSLFVLFVLGWLKM